MPRPRKNTAEPKELTPLEQSAILVRTVANLYAKTPNASNWNALENAMKLHQERYVEDFNRNFMKAA